MKLKKWKMIFIWIASIGSSSPIISNNLNQSNINKMKSLNKFTNNLSKTIIDYSLVRKTMNNLFMKEFYNQNNIKLNDDQQERIINLQNKYFNLFKSNNYSLEEMQDYMCENFSQYKEECNKEINLYNERSNSFNCKKTLTKKLDPSKPLDPHVVEYLKNELKDKVSSLIDQRNSLIVLCSSYTIAAAGFYAAAFWTFGATIPWAIACTTGSIQTGISQDAAYKQIILINNFIDIDFYETYNLIDNLICIKNCMNIALSVTFAIVGATVSTIIVICPSATGITISTQIAISIILECMNGAISYLDSLI